MGQTYSSPYPFPDRRCGGGEETNWGLPADCDLSLPFSLPLWQYSGLEPAVPLQGPKEWTPLEPPSGCVWGPRG